MRRGIILAAALMATPFTAISFTVMSATSAHAEDWCGFSARPNAIVQCGYSSLERCESAVGSGKGAMCFVNPDVTLNSRGAAPVIAKKHSGLTSWPDPLVPLDSNLLQRSISM